MLSDQLGCASEVQAPPRMIRVEHLIVSKEKNSCESGDVVPSLWLAQESANSSCSVGEVLQ